MSEPRSESREHPAQDGAKADTATRTQSRMFLLAWNALLALVWAFAVGQFTFGNVLVGFVLGYLALWLGARLLHSHEYCVNFFHVLSFMGFFLWELLLANLRVAHDILTPGPRMRPGILALPLDAETDLEITLLANLLSLTPGTLAMDVSPDRRVLYVHSMYARDVDAERRRIKSGLERRLLEVLR